MTIKQFKKLARAHSRINGTSYQAELDAIARQNGHHSWGALQRAFCAEPAQHYDPDLRKHPFVCKEILDLKMPKLGSWLDTCSGTSGLVIISGKARMGKSTTMEATRMQLFYRGIAVHAKYAHQIVLDGHIGEILELAQDDIVLLEVEADGLDQAIAKLIQYGFDNEALAKVYRGGIYQQIRDGRLEAMILPWE